MKKSIILAAVMLVSFAAQAQNYMVVNTEKVFTSITAYNDALTTLDRLGQQYQQNVDDAFAQLERTYDEYQRIKNTLTQSARDQREDQIIEREKEINAYQQQVFGQDGDLMTRRVELIKPIQDKVFEVIAQYARDNGYDLVLDIASNPSVLYYTPAADKTDEIIRLYR